MGAFTPGKDLVPIVQETGWGPEPIRTGAENLAPLEFNPQTFQPVASPYTDYTILAPPEKVYFLKILHNCSLKLQGHDNYSLLKLTSSP